MEISIPAAIMESTTVFTVAGSSLSSFMYSCEKMQRVRELTII